MTIDLPDDLERSLRSLVRGGRFASEEEAITAAVRLLLQRREDPTPPPTTPPGLGSVGAMRDAADELDAAVTHAMQTREQRPWRLSPGE